MQNNVICILIWFMIGVLFGDDQFSKVDDQILKFNDQLSKVTVDGGGADTAVSFGRRWPVSGVASSVPSGGLDY